MVSKYLRTPDAAAYLGVGRNTLNKWRLTPGAGPTYSKLSGRVVVYRVEDLDAWAEARRRESTNDTAPTGRAA